MTNMGPSAGIAQDGWERGQEGEGGMERESDGEREVWGTVVVVVAGLYICDSDPQASSRQHVPHKPQTEVMRSKG